jgi:hypothetical protein
MCGCALLLGCRSGSQPGIHDIDIGVDVRINAIIAVPERGIGLFAAASGGVVVDQDGHRWELSNNELWTLATDDHGRYWVCGDRGYLAFAEVEDVDTLPDWTPVATGTENNLYGLAATRSRVVVVGDETLLVGANNDGEWVWIPAPAPSDGWGQLRAVSRLAEGGATAFLVVGRDGRALLSSASAESWSPLEGLDPAVDYEHACGPLVLGGTLAHARWSDAGWRSGGGGAAADYLGCGGGHVLSSDRWISSFAGDEPEQVYRLPWQGRCFDPLGVYVAGDAGHVAYWDPGEVGEL